jgi:very-short-patch-repair endonuclease
MRRIHNHPSLKQRRRGLRQQATVAEAMLWKRLRRRQLGGRKFRRQHSVGRYVVDFYRAERRLVIELDGAAHDDPLRARADTERQRWLEAQELRVLRFRNEEVVRQSDVVLAAIEAVLSSPLPPAPSPLRGAGEKKEETTARAAPTAVASAPGASALTTPSQSTAEAPTMLSPSPPGEGAGGRGAER